MSLGHLHLMLNHLPLFGLAIGLLLLGAAMWRGSIELTQAAMVLLVLIAGAAVVVYLTGEAAEELVENLPDVSEQLVEGHEETALVATVGATLVGLAAAVGLWRLRAVTILPTWPSRLVLVLGLVTLALMARTAGQGGQIRHTEIRSELVWQSGEEDGPGDLDREQ